MPIQSLAWPAAVVVLAVIFMLLFRQPITRFIDRTKKVSREGIEAAAPAATQQETGSLVLAGEAPAQPTPLREELPPPALPGEPATRPEAPHWFVDMLEAFLARDLTKAEEAFARLQEETDDATKRLRNQATYLSQRYVYGADVAAFEQLRELAERPEVSGFAHTMIGNALGSVGQYREAADAFDKAAAAYGTDEDKARAIVRASRALFDAGLKDQALSRSTSALGVLNARPARAILYDGLATLYQQQGNLLMRALGLEKAVEYTPHDRQLRFQAAYTYQEVGFPKLALLHYKVLLSTDPKDATNWNNYGVAADSLGLPMLSARAYRQAVSEGYTLAMANLAYRFMNAGFETEARNLLDQARQKPDVHPNVGSAIADLSKKIEVEEKKEGEVLNGAGAEQRFLAEFASSRFETGQAPVDLSGTWVGPSGEQVAVSQTNGKVRAEWQDSITHYRMVGEVMGRTAEVRYERSALYMGKPLGIYSDDGTGYLVVTQSGTEIRILNKRDTEIAFATWKKANT